MALPAPRPHSRTLFVRDSLWVSVAPMLAIVLAVGWPDQLCGARARWVVIVALMLLTVRSLRRLLGNPFRSLVAALPLFLAVLVALVRHEAAVRALTTNNEPDGANLTSKCLGGLHWMDVELRGSATAHVDELGDFDHVVVYERYGVADVVGWRRQVASAPGEWRCASLDETPTGLVCRLSDNPDQPGIATEIRLPE